MRRYFCSFFSVSSSPKSPYRYRLDLVGDGVIANLNGLPSWGCPYSKIILWRHHIRSLGQEGISFNSLRRDQSRDWSFTILVIIDCHTCPTSPFLRLHLHHRCCLVTDVVGCIDWWTWDGINLEKWTEKVIRNFYVLLSLLCNRNIEVAKKVCKTGQIEKMCVK